MNLLPTLVFRWTVGGRLPLSQYPISGSATNGPTNQIYSDPIGVEGADQIGLFLWTRPSNGGVDGNVYLRLMWAGALADTSPTTFTEECIESVGAVVNNAQRYSIVPKEYGPFATVSTSSSAITRGTIWLPTAAHFFKIGCYSDTAVTLAAMVTVVVERSMTGNPSRSTKAS